MKKINAKLILSVVLILLVTLFTASPVFAATGTVDVRFVVLDHTGAGHSDVLIQFGKNSKTTDGTGTVQFHLDAIPATTMVGIGIVDKNTKSGLLGVLNLELKNKNTVQVNTAKIGSCDLTVGYSDFTQTIVIEFLFDKNNNITYKKVTFEQKPQATPQPTSPPAPATPPPPPPDPDANPPDAPPPDPDAPPRDPDAPPENPDAPPPDPDAPPRDPDAPPEDPDMPPGEFDPDMPPGDPDMPQDYPAVNQGGVYIDYTLLLIVIGALLLVGVVVIIIVVIKKKK